jgi:hypothetical protein
MPLLDRAKHLLLTPRSEWEVIDGEGASVAALYTGYILPLAAIGPVARVVGSSLFGIPYGRGVYRVPVGAAITAAVVMYVLSLAGVYVLALIIDALAPTFGGVKHQGHALKVAAYSSTAIWLAGIFSLVPMLRGLTILGLYSIVLLYLGLPVLMKAPAEKAGAYTAIVIVAGLVLFAVVTMLAGTFAATAIG